MTEAWPVILLVIVLLLVIAEQYLRNERLTRALAEHNAGHLIPAPKPRKAKPGEKRAPVMRTEAQEARLEQQLRQAADSKYERF